jgi:simple sugar transport system permease protein
VIAAVFFLHRTRTGRTIYAIGGAESSAQLMGLRVARTRVLIYVISGALAGVAAVVYTAEVGGAQNVTGIGWELDAIAAVVIGGTLLTGGVGYVLGSVVGTLVLGRAVDDHHEGRLDQARVPHDHHRRHPARLRAAARPHEAESTMTAGGHR